VKNAASLIRSPLPISIDRMKVTSLQRFRNRRKPATSNAMVDAPNVITKKIEKGPGPILWIPGASDVEAEHLGNDSVSSSNFCSFPFCVKYIIASEIFNAKGEPLGNTCQIREKDQNMELNGNTAVEHWGEKEEERLIDNYKAITTKVVCWSCHGEALAILC